MKDPLRWKETESEAMKTLLGKLSKVEPSVETREAVWAKLAVMVPPGSNTGGAEGGPSASAPIAAGTKLAGLAGTAIVVGALALWLTASPTSRAGMEKIEPPIRTLSTAAASKSASPDLPAVTETIAKASAPMPSVETPSSASPSDVPSSRARAVRAIPPPAPTSATPPPSAPGSGAPFDAATVLSVDSLREEAAAVKRARNLLRAHNPSASLAELERIGRLVPNGPLEEEREVLTIEALFASGNADVACRRADRFVFERSQSVHATRVRALCGNHSSKIVPTE